MHDEEWIHIQASTLFVLDEHNKIIRINERNQVGGPALFAGITGQTIATYFHHDLPQRIVEEIRQNIAVPINIVHICSIVEKYKQVKDLWIGPAYRFGENRHKTLDPNTTVIDGPAEAGLRTIPEFRGRGLALSVVSAWRNDVERLGLIPLYSTSWDNVSSQKAAQKIGFVQYGVDFHISTE